MHSNCGGNLLGNRGTCGHGWNWQEMPEFRAKTETDNAEIMLKG
jgi:hypothetical protein